MSRAKTSIAFWVVVLVLFLIGDTFFTPYLMNRSHGAMRIIGFAIGGFTFLPVVMLAIRIYNLIRTKMFVRSLGE